MFLSEIKITNKRSKRPVEPDSEYGVEGGRFIGLHFDEETKALLKRMSQDEQVAHTLDAEKYHTTVAYSKGSSIPGYDVAGKLDKPIEATIDSFGVFTGSEGNNCLVAKLDCPDCVKRHKRTRSHGGTHDYDDYVPHITLSYDAGEINPDRLEELTQRYKGTKVYAEEEYDSPIEKDFAKNS